MNTNATINNCGCAGEKKHCAPVVNQFYCSCCDGCEGNYNGSNVHSPYIGENGNWFEWSAETNDFIDTGVHAEGSQGEKGDPGAGGAYIIQEEVINGTEFKTNTYWRGNATRQKRI